MFVATNYLYELVQEAADHALSTAGEGFHVFVMTRGAEGPRLTRFITTVADGIEQARKHVAKNRTGMDRYAIAYDGAYTLDGVRSDAILIESGERPNPRAGLYGLPYRIESSGPVASGARVLLEDIDNAMGLEPMVIACPKCGAKNRIPLERLATSRAKCGACKNPLQT